MIRRIVQLVKERAKYQNRKEEVVTDVAVTVLEQRMERDIAVDYIHAIVNIHHKGVITVIKGVVKLG
jgi:hypothetical protein